MVCDANEQVRIAWIDFAKTEQLPEDTNVTHTCPWQPGTHEDGILLGLDGLISAFGRMVCQFEAEEGPKLVSAQALPTARERPSIFSFWWCCRDSTLQEPAMEEHFTTSSGPHGDDRSSSYTAVEATTKARANGS